MIYYRLDDAGLLWLHEDGKKTLVPQLPSRLIAQSFSSGSYTHPHEKCEPCKTASDAVEKEFVEACLKSYRGSFSELFEKLSRAGFRIQKQETPKP